MKKEKMSYRRSRNSSINHFLRQGVRGSEGDPDQLHRSRDLPGGGPLRRPGPASRAQPYEAPQTRPLLLLQSLRPRELQQDEPKRLQELRESVWLDCFIPSLLLPIRYKFLDFRRIKIDYVHFDSFLDAS